MSNDAPHAILPDTWTVKEVVADLKQDILQHLNKQDDMLAEIDRKVDSKADKSDLQALSGELKSHIASDDRRLTILEEHKVANESSARFRKRAWYVVASVASILAIIGGSLIAAFH